MVRAPRGDRRVHRNAYVTARAVLEPDRTGEPRRELAVRLTLGRARTNRGPADEIADILRRDGIDELGRGRHAHAVDLEQQLPRQPQAIIDVKRSIEIRIVDQAFPASPRPRFLEIHAHHDQQPVAELSAELPDRAGIFQCSGDVMDGTRADDDEQPGVFTGQNAADAGPRIADDVPHRRRRRQLMQQVDGRRDLPDVADPYVVYT